jgi:DNA repair exonuclease SbcCD nuclease subunit
VRIYSPVEAVLISDLHLSAKAPAIRAEEPSWANAMLRTIAQVQAIAAQHKAPIVCAGDVFNTWDSPPELINWALDNLPKMYAIPGNHELPSHNPQLEHRSAYGTLRRAGILKELSSWPTQIGALLLYGHAYGEPEPIRDVNFSGIHVLVTHQFLYLADQGHPGAPEEQKLSRSAGRFQGFDIVVAGDNHQPFSVRLSHGTLVVNCGSLMRRRACEDHVPCVWLLHRDQTVSRIELDISQDVVTQRETKAEPGEEDEENETISAFVEELKTTRQCRLDFRDNLLRAARPESKEIRELLLHALGD